jgi:hypothetical protein
MQDLISGVIPVAPTPFTEDEALDLDGQGRVIEYLIDGGCDAICILANYSEQFSLSDEERNLVMITAVEQAAGRIPIVVTASHFSAKIARSRVKAAIDSGAAAATLDADDIARVFNEPKPSEIAKIAEQVGAVPGQDVPAAGPYTSAWMKLIYDMPVDRIFSELEFSVESGSARKPNQSEKIANVDEIGKGLLQFFWQIYQA